MAVGAVPATARKLRLSFTAGPPFAGSPTIMLLAYWTNVTARLVARTDVPGTPVELLAAVDALVS